MTAFSEENVRRHFDRLAEVYDEGKQHNAYYYTRLKQCLQRYIPSGKSVLEIGCGTGDILHALSPAKGVGIDISQAMIERSRQKYPQETWMHGDITQFVEKNDRTFDVLLLADVVEHVPNIAALFSQLPHVSHPGTELIISMANPLWEPLLLLLEALHLKMPEGPHRRLKSKILLCALQQEGFEPSGRSFHVLLPTYIPLLSSIATACERVPLLRRCGVIEILRLEYVGKK